MPSNTNVFKKYATPKIFIETGSYLGEGISQAIEAGYEKIYSIELSPKYFNICSEKFKDVKSVNMLQGDSSEVLSVLLPQLSEPCVFWLDGHHSCGDTALGKKWAPLMDELEVISKHHVNTNTFLIDDMRCWKKDNPVIGYGEDEIKAALLGMNPNYKFSYEDGCEPNDILAAYL